MKPALVIGFGNPLRSDDVLGHKAIALLETEMTGERADLLACHQLTIEMSEDISRYRKVVFIDASDEEPRGKVKMVRLEPEPEVDLSFTHDFGPAALLAYAKSLFGHAPEAWLFTIGGENFEYGENLSPQVQAALPDLVSQVKSVLEQNTGKGAMKHA